MLKACAGHALTTCLCGYESTKAQGPVCLSCRGLAWGQPWAGGPRGKASEKPHRNAAFKTVTALLSMRFQTQGQKRGQLLYTTEPPGKPQSSAEPVTNAPSPASPT